jgi:uncharacterized RDD family membrane protein YckC
MEEASENLLTDFEEPEYRFVGFWPRFGALLIDGVILIVTGYLFTLFFSDTDSIAFILITSIIPFLYHPVMEYYSGATIGKMAIGIKIVNHELQKLSLSNVIVRNLIYIVLQIISICIELYGSQHPEENRNPFANIFSNDYGTDLYVKLSIIYFISIIIIYVLELIFLLTDEKFRTLHDRIGKTYVVQKTR